MLAVLAPGPQPVATALEDVAGAPARVYAARDERGTSLDCLDVLALGPGDYLGVHHVLAGGVFETHLVVSRDLLRWRFAAVLAEHADMPTLAALPGGGFVLAYERTGPAGRTSQLAFRRYEDLAALQAGRAADAFLAPRTLSDTNEGTPDIAVVDARRLAVTFHYFADTDGNGSEDADRQAGGLLEDFERWNAAPRPEVDAAFLHAQRLHPGFDAPPDGNIGDRSAFAVGSRRLVAHEAQYAFGDFSTWRLWLRDPAAGTLTPLVLHTDGGSTAFGNPSVRVVPDPAGRPVLFESAYVFAQGAAPGEAGELIALHPAI